MKSFIKFVGFIMIWCVVYLLVSSLFNWGVGLLGNVIDFNALLGKIILISICSSVMWTILFYPTLIISAFLLDKKIYAVLALVLMILYNLLALYVYYQYGWAMIIVWIVHAFSTIFPVWSIMLKVSSEEEEAKQQKEKEYKEALKAEIIKEMNNGNS